MRFFLVRICMLLFAFDVFVPNQNMVYCEEQSPAYIFVNDMGKEVLDVLKNNSSEKERCSKLLEKLKNKVNFEQLAKASLTKKHYEKVLKKEHNFLKYFENMAVKYVVSLMQKYDSKNVKFEVVSRVQKSGKNYRVASRIIVNETFNVNWIVSSDMKIVDIVAEGVSLKGILKTQVYDVIKRNGEVKFLKEFVEKYKDL